MPEMTRNFGCLFLQAASRLLPCEISVVRKKVIFILSYTIKNTTIFFIKFYRNIFSNNMLHYCRFYPTCSQYAIESIEKKGVFRGSASAIFRILRCNPLSKGGFDPIH